MIGNIKGVKNPLTVIAIFACLAEVSGTGILPFISDSNQRLYIYFLIAFPLFLVACFFFVLYRNHRVLYAPSDYRDENNFFRSTPNSRRGRREWNASGSKEADISLPPPPPNSNQQPASIRSPTAIGLSEREFQTLANEVIDRIANELHCNPMKNAQLLRSGKPMIFDAVYELPREIAILEIKYVSQRADPAKIKSAIHQAQRGIHTLAHDTHNNAYLILAIIHDMSTSAAKAARDDLESIVEDTDIACEIRMFSRADLT